MIWTVIVAKAAKKQLARFPAKDQEKLAATIRTMADDAFSGDIIKLEGENNRWRRRVGSYRIFFTIDTSSKSVGVSAVVRRTSSTY
jgi:mRNA-degrading endonuclease RelE of RelBE toxin-antitoxin system